MNTKVFTIFRRTLASPADAAAFLRQKRASDKLATTTTVAERLRNSNSTASPSHKDPKLNSFYSQTVGSGRVTVDNTTGKKPKLTSMYTKDAHLD